jgi:hypothetical protein
MFDHQQLPVSASVPRCLESDCALLPASPLRKRVVSVWTGKDSLLDLEDKIFTCINVLVKIILYLNYSPVIMYLLLNESHFAYKFIFYLFTQCVNLLF